MSASHMQAIQLIIVEPRNPVIQMSHIVARPREKNPAFAVPEPAPSTLDHRHTITVGRDAGDPVKDPVEPHPGLDDGRAAVQYDLLFYPVLYSIS